ncbi:MAG: T9SS type A sorting domain-containing protein [Bacteroidetes bacterium]|nr:T9SS type A sorting domain-containing protein [Bacteroidota bacterium]
MLINNSQSQSIPNGDFENWSNKFLYNEPQIYTTSNSQAFMQNLKIPVTKSSEKVSGNYSIKIETVAGENEPISGMLILGNPGNQTIKGGYPIVGRPDSISFFAKYSEMIGDTGAFVAFFKRNDTTIAISRFTFIGTQLTFIKVTIPINWFRSGNSDTMALVITSSNFDSEKKAGSYIYIDSIKFIGFNGNFPNGNFENWKSITSIDPDNWLSFNFMTTEKPMITRTIDKFSGSYALQIENVKMNFGNIMGFITNGRIGDSKYPTGGLAVSLNPSKVKGYYKYIPNGPDTAIGGLFLYRWDSQGDSLMLLEDTIFKLLPTNTFTYFEIPLLYKDKPKADTINIAFSASDIDKNPSYQGLGSKLLIDKLEIEYKPNNISKVKSNKFIVYPNPSNEKISFNLIEAGQNYTQFYLEIYDINGKLKNKTAFLSNKAEIKKENIGLGMYFYKIKTTNEEEIHRGKFIFN